MNGKEGGGGEGERGGGEREVKNTKKERSIGEGTQRLS